MSDAKPPAIAPPPFAPPPPPFAPPAGELPRGGNVGRWVLILGGLCIAAFIVLNCSGLVFPIVGRQSDLEGWLKQDFGVALPASAVVDSGDRWAYRDPERRYGVKMKPADVPKLVNAIKTAAVARTATVSPDIPTVAMPKVIRPPTWWPATLPADASEFGVIINGDSYSIVYSVSAGRVWVVRQST